MNHYSPQQLIPVLSSNDPILKFEHLFSPQQIRLLARIDESSSLSMIATLLQISLYDCILEIKTLLFRGVLTLYARESPKKNRLQPLSWEDSVQQLEMLQDTLQGKREHTGKTLIDMFPTPARQQQWLRMQENYSDRLSEETGKSVASVAEQPLPPDAKGSSGEKEVPTLLELPKVSARTPTPKPRATGGVLPTPPMIRAFAAETPVEEGSQSHTLSSMEVPSFALLGSCSSLSELEAALSESVQHPQSQDGTAPAIASAASLDSVRAVEVVKYDDLPGPKSKTLRRRLDES